MSRIAGWRILEKAILNQSFASPKPKCMSCRRALNFGISSRADLARLESAADTEGFNRAGHCLAMSTNTMSPSQLLKVRHCAWYKAAVTLSADTIQRLYPRGDLI